MNDYYDPVVYISEPSSWHKAVSVPETVIPPKLSSNSRKLDYSVGAPRVNQVLFERPQDHKAQKRAELASIFYSFPEVRNVWCDKVSYVAITDSRGEWVSHIQYTNTRSRGYGIVDRRGGEWDFSKIISLNGMFPYYGSNGSGDVNEHYMSLIKLVESDSPVDVVLCDSSMARPAVSLYVALSTLKRGGCFLCRMSEVDESVLYVALKSFEWITLFRPLISHVYLVCFGYLPNVAATSLARDIVSGNNGVSPNDSSLREWIDETIEKLASLNATKQFDWMTVRRILDV